MAELTTDFDRELPPVPCLAGEFNQVILNLIVNAAHAIADVVKESGRMGRVHITTRRDEEVVVERYRHWAAVNATGEVPEAVPDKFTRNDVAGSAATPPSGAGSYVETHNVKRAIGEARNQRPQL